MAKYIRNHASTQDPSSITSIQHNPATGAEKNINVGAHLVPIPKVSGGILSYTTNVSAAPQVLPTLGKALAIYNNSGSLGAITLGEDNTITALAAGVTDATGHVGIPCPANSWTHISCGIQNWVISTASTMLVFMVDDDTSIKQEVASYKGN